MCELISRRAAIDELNVLCQEHRYRIPGKRETYSEYNEAWQDALDRAEGAICNLPSVQPQRWIPVSEALPDRGKTVLITNDKGNVRSGRFRGIEFWKDDGGAYWIFKGNTVEHVLAWMPLPEPYEPQESEVKK